jgi:hypothetical protein
LLGLKNLEFKKKILILKKYFLFTALLRTYDEDLNSLYSSIFLILSLILIGIIAGIRGTILYSIQHATRIYEHDVGHYYKILELDPLRMIESGILEISFFIGLLLIYTFIYTGEIGRRITIVHDIALIAQLSLIKDILFLFLLYLSEIPIGSSIIDYAFRSQVGNIYNLGLNLPYLLFLTVFFIPRLMEKVKGSFSEYDRQFIISLVLSMIILIFLVLINSMVNNLIVYPLGLA